MGISSLYQLTLKLSKMKNQIKIREEWRSLNVQINSQLKRAGVVNHKGKIVKPLLELPDSEWKTWILELIKYRDSLTSIIA